MPDRTSICIKKDQTKVNSKIEKLHENVKKLYDGYSVQLQNWMDDIPGDSRDVIRHFFKEEYYLGFRTVVTDDEVISSIVPNTLAISTDRCLSQCKAHCIKHNIKWKDSEWIAIPMDIYPS